MSFMLYGPSEMLVAIAKKAQAKRLAHNFTQKTLSLRSGVSLGVIKKFEHTGKISLESLLKIALTLDSFNEFDSLFNPKAPENFSSLDQLLKEHKRKRGRL